MQVSITAWDSLKDVTIYHSVAEPKHPNFIPVYKPVSTSALSKKTLDFVNYIITECAIIS